MKIALICNNAMALPAMQRLAGTGRLAAIGVPDKHAEIVALLRGRVAELGLPFTVFTKKMLRQQLSEWLSATGADVVFVMTFPWKIPGDILGMPANGFINFHYGLLPEMRGADPIFESIRRRKPAAGLTVHLMDEGYDTGAIIAYLKSLPPVDNTRTRIEINFPARLLIDIGVFGDLVRVAKIDFRAQRPKPPNNEGKYLIDVGGCTFCHGLDLAGGQGPEPGAPAGTDLTRGGPLSRWSLSGFTSTMRNGVDPAGHAIDPKYMPWLGYRNMTDAELQAIWQYLRSLPARSKGA